MVVTVKLFVLEAVPSVVVKDTEPVIAPGITIPVKVVPVLETTIAVLPPIVNAVGLLKLIPVTVTKVPTEPEVGVKEIIAG